MSFDLFTLTGGMTPNGIGEALQFGKYASRNGNSAVIHPRIFDKALKSYAGTPQQIKVCIIGDSLASRKHQVLIPALQRMLRIKPVNISSSFSNVDRTRCNRTVLSGTYATGSDYSLWITGQYNTLTSSSDVKMVIGGADPTFASIKVWYFREAGAGTFDVLVDGASVQTVDADGAAGLQFYEYSQTQSKKEVRLVGSTGDVKIAGVTRHLASDDVEVYSVSMGGLSLANGVAYSSALENLGAMLAETDPDIITYEMDDRGSEWETAVETLSDTLDTHAANSMKLFIASTPAAENEQIAQLGYLQKLCFDRGYTLFDGNTPVAPYSKLVALGWEGDGIHPNLACQQYLGGLLVAQIGLDTTVYGSSSKPIVSSEPSRIAYLSRIEGPGESYLEFYTDNSFGLDWELRFPRALSFTDLEGNKVARFSDNHTVRPNFIPKLCGFQDSALEMDASSTGQLALKDTTHASGYSKLLIDALKIKSRYTVATLPSSGAGSEGDQIYATDARSDGGGCFLYSDGENWRRLSDDVIPT